MGLFYTSTFVGAGVMLTFLPVYLELLGLSATAIAGVFAARTAVSMVVQPAWGLWADRVGNARHPLLVATAISAVMVTPLWWVRSPTVVVLILVLHAFSSSAIGPLMDSLTLTLLKHAPEGFGRVRLVGSLAYGLGVLALTTLLPGQDSPARMELAGRISVPVMCTFQVINWIVALQLPLAHKEPLRRVREGTASLLGSPVIWLLLGVGALHWGAHAPYTVFLSVHLRSLDLGPGVVAAATCVAVAAEVIAMYFTAQRLTRINLQAALAVCVGSGAVRWVLSGFVRDPVALVAVQALHGLTFGVFLLVLVRAVHDDVPEHARSTAQGLLNATVFGVGGVLGMMAAGAARDAGGGEWMFRTGFALEIVAMGLLATRGWIVRGARARIGDRQVG